MSKRKIVPFEVRGVSMMRGALVKLLRLTWFLLTLPFRKDWWT